MLYADSLRLGRVLFTNIRAVRPLRRENQDLVWESAEDLLLNPGAALFWSEHSARAVLPSWGAALGFTGGELDYTGRWSPQGSDAYVRTGRSALLRLHEEIT
jgi:hypothetical protein